MKRTPVGMYWVGGADFVSCVMATAREQRCLNQFTSETGLSLEWVIASHGRNFEEATGHEAEVIAAFADWVCEKIWGEEEDEG